MRHYRTPNARNARLALASIAVIAAGLTVGVGIPTPNSSPAPTATVTPYSCEEDMPCWDPHECAEIGNKVCGAVSDATEAWETWDLQQGWRKLAVDPSRPYRVDYMVSTPEYPENMDTYDLALNGTDGRWYVFRASYTDVTV